jgi:hypothetical protein
MEKDDVSIPVVKNTAAPKSAIQLKESELIEEVEQLPSNSKLKIVVDNRKYAQWLMQWIFLHTLFAVIIIISIFGMIYGWSNTNWNSIFFAALGLICPSPSQALSTAATAATTASSNTTTKASN